MLAPNGGEWSTSRHWWIYPQGRIARNTLKRRLGRPDSLSECCGEGKNLLLL